MKGSGMDYFVSELLKSMNIYELEDVNKFCQDILDEQCTNIYKSMHRKYKDVETWVFYIMLLRQWPTKDLGTFIDYFQRFLHTFQQLKAPFECGLVEEDIRKEKRLPTIKQMWRTLVARRVASGCDITQASLP